jgi:hypothetical protein
MSEMLENLNTSNSTSQLEITELPKFNFLAIWFICCTVGYFTVWFNTTVWNIVLGIKADDKITLFLHYFGLTGVVLYSFNYMFMNL